jgi:hypothetical protein
MEQFSIDDWVDFARQVEGQDHRIAMQRHLDDGCSECSRTVATWRHVVAIAQVESTYEPPDWAVRAVQGSFSLRKTPSSQAGTLELARLLFDSALQPVAIGVRGSSPIVRQLLYKSGSVCIDMLMQPTPGSDAVVLMGQLLDSSKPDHGVSGIPVSLLCDGDTVSRGQTNDVGEFDFGITALDHLQLVFGIGARRTIVVRVPDGDSSLDMA